MIKLKDHHWTTISFASVNRKWCWNDSVRYCGHLSGIPADLTRFRLIYQPPWFFMRREIDRAVLYKSLFKSTPLSMACWSRSEACNRNTMSEAGENSQAKLPVSSPVSGREILGLTSSPLTEGGKCSLGERVGRHVNMERGGPAGNGGSAQLVISYSLDKHLKSLPIPFAL